MTLSFFSICNNLQKFDLCVIWKAAFRIFLAGNSWLEGSLKKKKIMHNKCDIYMHSIYNTMTWYYLLHVGVLYRTVWDISKTVFIHGDNKALYSWCWVRYFGWWLRVSERSRSKIKYLKKMFQMWFLCSLYLAKKQCPSSTE